jgi:hypothetical protein
VALLLAVGATGKTLLVLNRTDEAAHRAFRNLPNVVIAEPGHVTTYDVLWSDRSSSPPRRSAMWPVPAVRGRRHDFVKESVGGESEGGE